MQTGLLDRLDDVQFSCIFLSLHYQVLVQAKGRIRSPDGPPKEVVKWNYCHQLSKVVQASGIYHNHERKCWRTEANHSTQCTSTYVVFPARSLRSHACFVFLFCFFVILALVLCIIPKRGIITSKVLQTCL